MPELSPAILHVPGVLASHEIGDDEDDRAEAEVAQHREGVLGETGVAVIEGDEHVAAGGLHRLHLAPKRARSEPGEPQLEPRVDLVIAENVYRNFSTFSSGRPNASATPGYVT